MDDPKRVAPPVLADLAKDYLKEEQKQRRSEIETLICALKAINGTVCSLPAWSGVGFVTNRDKLQAPFISS